MRRLFIVFLLFMSFPLWSQSEKLDDFVVTIYDRSIKVVAPDAIKSKFFVVVENRSQGKVIGKLQSSSGKIFAIMSIEAGQFNKTAIDNKKGERYFYLPLAPAFQEAELIVGHKTYEIPPRH